MQFKLLNFHSFLGNFATSMVGTFIPLLIYKVTGSLRLAVLFLMGQGISRILSNHIFKKAYSKYPQIMLFIRIIPLLIYNIALLLLDKFMIVGLIISMITYGMNLSIKNSAQSIILNYTSKKKSEKKVIFSRFITALSGITSAILGGLFMDFDERLLIVISVVLYIISVLPLLIYYITHRYKVGFNKDFISNAAIVQDKVPKLKEKRQHLVRNFVIQYFLFYALFCVCDDFSNMYTLYLFISIPTYAKAGYLSAMFQFANLVGVLCLEWINKKMDMRVANTIAGILASIPIILIPLIQNNVAVYILFFIFGFTYSICSYFMMDSLLQKCKILGCTNKALSARQDGVMITRVTSTLLIAIIGDIFPIFILMTLSLVFYAIYTHIMEERLRKSLVDYLEDND